MRVLVTTPTGHIGRRVIERLTGYIDISVFVRDPAHLSNTNVEIHTGTLEDAGALTRAATGADALLFIIPPNMTVTDWDPWIQLLASNAAEAIRAGHVARVVFLSSFGAQLPNLGPITFLGQAEDTLRAAAPNLTVLRASFFMDNLLSSVPTVRDASAVYGVFAPDLAIPMVARRDVADVAADRLLDATWSGQSIRGVQGPADITFTDVARAIGTALGRPVKYVQAPFEVAEGGMRAAGMSESVVTGYGAMFRGLATLGRKAAAEPRTPESTTPTTIDEFARTVFVPAVTAASADSSLLHAV